ncbi:hypothetical protein BV898_02576 [Hypsibius exemplaris]|uniref:LysM domain-containing protein n=1 Tax=Hypsibius exemplaris TaxID=2072580 RepID=A0A1W0X7R4_HYPEX|nr:hypothetical protein BV898_02576 [Hypsibius exemplaris]
MSSFGNIPTIAIGVAFLAALLGSTVFMFYPIRPDSAATTTTRHPRIVIRATEDANPVDAVPSAAEPHKSLHQGDKRNCFTDGRNEDGDHCEAFQTVAVPEAVHKHVPDSVREHVPVPEPVHEHVPVREPVHEHVPVPEPVHEHVPVPEPIHEHVPVPKPVHEHVPVPNAVQEQAHVPEPVHEHDSVPDNAPPDTDKVEDPAAEPSQTTSYTLQQHDGPTCTAVVNPGDTCEGIVGGYGITDLARLLTMNPGLPCPPDAGISIYIRTQQTCGAACSTDLC